MGDISVEVWLNNHRFDALDHVLNEQGSSVEKQMQNYLINLYCEMVTPECQQKIDKLINEEKLREEQRVQEQREFSVYHIRENGTEHFFEVDSPMELIQTAHRLRKYMRGELTQSPETFAASFGDTIPISAQKFEEYANIHIENSRNITGVFDIDFDKQEISAIHLGDGWKTYSMKDASTAEYQANRADYNTLDQRWLRFLEYLDGRELTQEQSFQTPSI